MSGKKTWADNDLRNALRAVFDSAIASAAPAPAVLRNLPNRPAGRCVIIGAGKASAAMAATLESAWHDVDLTGVISTRYGHAVAAGRVEIIEAGHPIPDENSTIAAHLMLEAVTGLTPNDLVVALVSGGGSASLALPIDPLELEEKQRITRQLLKSGASIDEMNIVRTHLSKIKGGRLAAAANPARVVTLLISDVPGDEAAAIASGPTVACKSSPADALEVIDRLGIKLSDPVRLHLATAEVPELDSENRCRIIASPAQALHAAARKAKELGYTPIILGDSIEGESRELGRAMAGIARSVRNLGAPAKAPAIIISGGETTVTIGPEGAGQGGRNTEFSLALALTLQGEPGIFALAGDSDGIDGTEDAAGAIVTPDTLQRARAAGLDPRDHLTRHDSYSLFAATGDLVVTGPTLTNVNDIRLVMVGDQ